MASLILRLECESGLLALTKTLYINHPQIIGHRAFNFPLTFIAILTVFTPHMAPKTVEVSIEVDRNGHSLKLIHCSPVDSSRFNVDFLTYSTRWTTNWRLAVTPLRLVILGVWSFQTLLNNQLENRIIICNKSRGGSLTALLPKEFLTILTLGKNSITPLS